MAVTLQEERAVSSETRPTESVGFVMPRPDGGLLEASLGKTPLLGKQLTCAIQMILTLDVCVCVWGLRCDNLDATCGRQGEQILPENMQFVARFHEESQHQVL